MTVIHIGGFAIEALIFDQFLNTNDHRALIYDDANDDTK